MSTGVGEQGPDSPRRPATGRRDALLTVVLVAGLLLAVGAIVALDLVPSPGGGGGGDRTSVAAGPASAEPSAEVPDDQASRLPGRMPDRKSEGTDPPTQAEPPPLPTLDEMDVRLEERGLERVPQTQIAGLTFTVATFNVLGASHTRGPNARRGYAGAEARLGPQLAALEAKQVGVVGAQEFQQDQVRALARRGGDWDIFPGLELGAPLADNSILWRPSLWERVRTRTTRVPYFGGRPTPMPQVLLEHRETGRKVWFANFHNPADVRGNAAGFRQRALEIEADLALQLNADGTPVILTGDMNDRERFACPFSRLSGMVSADGARTQDGQCITPRGMFVDWIWGTTDLELSGFVADRSIERRKLSDHPLITSDVTLPGVEDRPGCREKLVQEGLFWYCRA